MLGKGDKLGVKKRCLKSIKTENSSLQGVSD
jgi:hypothetical protein